MIFYFTGTGNSLMAAKAVARSGEELINMADARKQGNCKYEYDYSTINAKLPKTFEIPAFSFTEIVIE